MILQIVNNKIEGYDNNNTIDPVWFLCLIIYQPSWVIKCQSHSCRKTAAVLFNPLLGGNCSLYITQAH